jgi:hypothetical protein
VEHGDESSPSRFCAKFCHSPRYRCFGGVRCLCILHDCDAEETSAGQILRWISLTASEELPLGQRSTIWCPADGLTTPFFHPLVSKVSRTSTQHPSRIKHIIIGLIGLISGVGVWGECFGYSSATKHSKRYARLLYAAPCPLTDHATHREGRFDAC